MAKATGAHRVAQIATPLGADVLILTRMTGREELGRLSEYRVDMVSEKAEIKPEDILGKNVTIAMETGADSDPRYFNGMVTQFAWLGEVVTNAFDTQRGYLYRAVIHPFLWLLTRSADCRIFQAKSVPDIIKEICRPYGAGDPKTKLSGTYDPWEYCVQYRETDFNFVSRLMEQEGIAYYFEHEDGKHTLVLTDDYSSYSPGKPKDILYYEHELGEISDADFVNSFLVTSTIQPGIYALNDFNPLKSKVKIGKDAQTSRSYSYSKLEIFDYPGEYEEAAEGTTYSKIRLQEGQSQYQIYSGVGNVRALKVGALHALTEHPVAALNKEYLVTSMDFSIEINDLQSSSGAGATCSMSFTAIESKEPFRPQRITPKPLVQGSQTAIVVGPKGEEIYVDKYGRVKVHFHWDRHQEADENSSCWIRVASPWAGKQWGMINHPRIGQEVIVDFLEGDPDRPIITGRVYNDDAMPPYALPDEKTKSTLKSLSSKGGGGFNEFRFEDKKGSEQVFLNAQRNLDVRVGNDSFENVGGKDANGSRVGNRHVTIEMNRYDKVGENRHLMVEVDDKAAIKGNQSLKLDGDRMTEIGGSESLKVTGDVKIDVTGDTGLKVTGKLAQKVTGKTSLDVSADIHQKAATNIAIQAGAKIHIKAGATLVVEAGAQLSLKVGGNFIDINPGGVFIKGTMVMINSGGSAGSGDGASPDSPAAPDAPDPPEAAKPADSAKPGEKTDAKAEKISPPSEQVNWTKLKSPQAQALKNAADSGAPFCEKCEEAKKQQQGSGSGAGGGT